jgi:hypothetical protein
MHQSWPGVRRRRDSQPSIHLPRVVYRSGTKIGAAGLIRLAFGAKKSSLAASTRPPVRADARSASRVNAVVLSSRPLIFRLLECCMLVRSGYGKSRVRIVQVRRRGDRHDCTT